MTSRRAVPPCRRGGGSPLALKVDPVVLNMFSPGHQSQIGKVIVERIVVNVVDNMPNRNRPVRLFPNQTMTLAPDVRLSDLDPRPAVAASPVPSSYRDCSNRDLVGRGRPDLAGSWVIRAAHAIHRISAIHRAVGAGGFAVLEHHTTDRTSVHRHGNIVAAIAGIGTRLSGGTGTVAGVAHALGRHGIHVDLSKDYLRLAKWRIEESNLVARTLERTGIKVPEPPKIDGQLDMFDGAA